MYELGDVVTLTLTIRNPITGLVEDAGDVDLTITPDAGVPATPTINHVALSGIYTAAYPTIVEGRHPFRWVATGANAGTHDDVFTVDPPAGVFVSQAEALAHMRATTTITSAADLDELRRLIRVACDAVERDLDRVIAPRTVVETFDGGRSGIVLASAPVISITTVEDAGTALTADQYTFSSAAGILYRGGTTSPTCWTAGRNGVTVTYRAGYLQPPWIARQVALRGVQRMWQQSQQMPHPGLDDLGAEGMLFTPAGILTPLEMGAYEKLRRLAIA